MARLLFGVLFGLEERQKGSFKDNAIHQALVFFGCSPKGLDPSEPGVLMSHSPSPNLILGRCLNPRHPQTVSLAVSVS